MELLTAAQMRAIEQAAIDSGEVTGLELMERAGRGVVEAIFEWRPELADGERSAVVLCGPGNNGGDGFVVARLLKERGWTVEVFLYGDEAKLPPDAAENARRWREVGEIRKLDSDLHDYICERVDDLILDALFGGGLNRSIPEGLAENTHGILTDPNNRSRIVSVDVPSGMCANSGRSLSEITVPGAGLTVTFHSFRVGHLLNHAPWNCGQVKVVELGLDVLYDKVRNDRTHPLRKAFNKNKNDAVRGVDGSKVRFVDKSDTFHKYDHGHALVLSGGMGRSGAARLAARGALRIGAGLVTVAAPTEAMAENAVHLTAIMLREMGGAEGLAETLADERINAVCLGPGLGVNEETRELVAVACGHEPQPRTTVKRRSVVSLDSALPDEAPDRGPGLHNHRKVVLDADALTSFADDPPALFALLHENCVLTPHEGEFGRLFPDILEKLNAPATTGPAYSKVDATREAAARAGCVVLFKGADTVIADPSGRASINSAHYERAAPWLATAGSGDVLAGMITGLLARGLSPMNAAESAAWLHVECGRHLGPGLIAEDIPEALPDILKQVLGWKHPLCDKDA